ncbi:MAG: glycyl-radical enzyme activating protein [Synergistaceae bacterium]|jgi:pyruvate formate lyase activating enzyme|nr:glycyl-radical enzyme activating protein [Synergistaceae bacterium]
MVRDAEEERGVVLRMERGSTHDGEGFRTVVFLKGCPLRCWWCSTPEGQSFEIENADEKVYGRVMTVGDVIKEVKKDTAFFFHSGGGVTLSGGEILSQPEFSLALLRASRANCINTAIETSFYAPWSVIRDIIPLVNTAFVDIKIFDQKKHEKLCGVDNTLIMDNLSRTNEVESALKLIVRIPLIPGVNDATDELAQIGKFCAGLKRLRGVQLLPYHRLGVDTYRKLGRPYPLSDIQPPEPEYMSRCREIIRLYVKAVF